MIKGLYSAYNGMDSAWKYQDVLSNNIANANTAGFKRETATQGSFQDALLSQQTPVPAPIAARVQAVVGTIGTGSFITDFSTDFTSGAPQNTGNELDFALTNGFFQVQSPDGTVYSTRDGRFGRDANGDLVTSQGDYVLDTAGQHINLPATPVTVAGDGTIADSQGNAIAQLSILDFTPSQLTRAGEAYFTTSAPGQPVDGGLRQGYIENSNTDLVEEMTTLLTVERAYQANQTIFAKLDGTLDIAAGQLGRFGN